MINSLYDEMTVVEATSSLMYSKLDYEYNMCMLEHKQNIANIEYKAINENVSFDDLTEMYYREAEETKQKSGNILSRIIGAIKKLFKKIKEFIFGSKDNKDADPNEQVAFPEDPDELAKETRGWVGKLKNAMSGKKDGSDSSSTETVGKKVKRGIVTVGISAATNIVMNKLKPTIDLAEANTDELLKAIESGKLSQEEQQKCKGILGHIQNCGSRLSNCVSSVFHRKKKDDSDQQDDDKNKSENNNASNSEGSSSTEENSDSVSRLTSENEQLVKTIAQLNAKLRGDDKNTTWRDQRQINKIRKLENTPKKELTKAGKAKLEKLRSERGISDKNEIRNINNMIKQLQTRYNANNKEINRIKANKVNQQAKNDRAALKNVKNGSTSSSDLLKSANELLK